MASSTAETQIALEVPSAKVPMLPLILATIQAILASVAVMGGALFYLLRSGRIPLQKAIVVETRTEAPPPSPKASHVMLLQPMVANLADPSGAAYLKLSLALSIADDANAKGAAEKEAASSKEISGTESAVRDTVLTVLGRQTAEQLLAPDGKEHLKAALKSALSEHNSDVKINDLYFIDFLVQR